MAFALCHQFFTKIYPETEQFCVIWPPFRKHSIKRRYPEFLLRGFLKTRFRIAYALNFQDRGKLAEHGTFYKRDDLFHAAVKVYRTDQRLKGVRQNDIPCAASIFC